MCINTYLHAHACPIQTYCHTDIQTCLSTNTQTHTHTHTYNFSISGFPGFFAFYISGMSVYLEIWKLWISGNMETMYVCRQTYMYVSRYVARDA